LRERKYKNIKIKRRRRRKRREIRNKEQKGEYKK